MTSHQRKTSIAGQAFRFGSFLSRISVAPVVLLGAGGSGVPSNNLRSRLRRLVLVFLPAMLTVILVAPSALAASNGAPEINTFQINESSPKTFRKKGSSLLPVSNLDWSVTTGTFSALKHPSGLNILASAQMVLGHSARKR